MKWIPVRLLKWLRPTVIPVSVSYVCKMTNSASTSPFLSSSPLLHCQLYVLQMWSKSHVVWKHLHLFLLPDPSEIISTCFTNHRYLLLRLPRLPFLKGNQRCSGSLFVGRRGQRVWHLLLFSCHLPNIHIGVYLKYKRLPFMSKKLSFSFSSPDRQLNWVCLFPGGR